MKTSTFSKSTLEIEQDAVKVAPEAYTVLLENEHVRVLDIRVKPGGSVPMHSHPTCILYAITDVKAIFTLPDGTRRDEVMRAGEARWTGSFSHAAENIGKTELHVLAIEFKEPLGEERGY